MQHLEGSNIKVKDLMKEILMQIKYSFVLVNICTKYQSNPLLEFKSGTVPLNCLHNLLVSHLCFNYKQHTYTHHMLLVQMTGRDISVTGKASLLMLAHYHKCRY